MRALNLWRMDLVFLISGLALGFLRPEAGRGRLFGQRSWRLLLPLAFDGSDFGVTWNHLWYLPYLWCYTAALLLVLPLLGRPAGLRLRLAGALVLLALLMGLRAAWPPVEPGPWRLVLRCLADLYLWTALLAILGWAHAHLNRPWPWLPWANEQVYPWYVLHQTVIIVLVVWLAPLQLPVAAQALLLVAGTIAGCWGGAALVRRSSLLRPLFGLKPRARPPHLSPATPAHPAARSA